MKKRIVAAAILVPLLLLITLVLDKLVAAIVMGLLLAIASYELLYRTELVRHPRLVVYASVMAFAVSIWSYFGAIHPVLLLLMMAYFVALFAELMLDHVKVRIEMLGLCLLSGLVLPFLLTSLVRILTMNVGRFVVLIPFAVAFVSDAGAYFVGMKFGRHKMAPVVSPNKTIEGALGGVGAAMAAMLVYALILTLLKFRVNYGLALLYGLLGSLAGIFGDLCFSVIKRQTGIKDYGNLIPGHGGVLDRFDSLVLVAPLMEALLLLLPMVSV
ncbi:MAG: phosphatidate cytidylyltransferase [Eubacteriales bacterium]|nr:phosphatidate cytidylyltransferase [Eubacteriales bacterium]